MTYREKLAIDHPEDVNMRYIGGCKGCPQSIYPTAKKPDYCWHGSALECRRCWDREAPEFDYNAPEEFLRMILKRKDLYKGFTFVITGKGGPTGKTWLTEKLRHNGFNAVEVTEAMLGYVDYNDDANHHAFNCAEKWVLIVLNTPLNLSKKSSKKMTVAEIEKELGYTIEIVSED